MDENEVKDLKNKAKELLNTVDPEKEISTIAKELSTPTD